MAAQATSRPRRGGWQGVYALGVVTITAYGSWFYGFGVLVGPINEDTGWSTTALGLIYGAAQVISGVGAFFGGRLLDRFGTKGPFALQAVAGGGLMLASTWAADAWLFGVLYAVGAGVTGGTGFYHVTTALSARLRPDRPEQAIARLTVVGALCSPIYLPFTAWLVSNWHWRTASRVLAALAIAGALYAIAVARGGASTERGPSTNPTATMLAALRDPAIRRMLAVFLLGGISFAAVLVYQVPILTSAGMTLGTAGAIGGFRGFCQIFGRIGLTGIVERHGARSLLRLAYAISAAGVALLLVGNVPAGLLYGLLAGAALGASSPLTAIYARTHFDEGDLGLLMGLQGAAMGVAGGIGPFLGGLFNDLTDSWTPTVLISIAGLVGAAALLTAPPPPSNRPPTTTT